MVQAGRWIVLEEAAEFIEPLAGRFGVLVSIGGQAQANGGKGGAAVIIMLVGGPVVAASLQASATAVATTSVSQRGWASGGSGLSQFATRSSKNPRTCCMAVDCGPPSAGRASR